MHKVINRTNGLHKDFTNLVRSIYGDGFVPLHRPVFEGNEKQYLIGCINSNFVSSVGEQVSQFEEQISGFTGASYAVATVNGTAALQIALKISGVRETDEVLTQALTFVATVNAISHNGASPVFLDVDLDTMGMSPVALRNFLEKNVEMRGGCAWNKSTGQRISACVPMHTFGLPCRIEEISALCNDWNITLVEDSAESLGSYVGGRHAGTFGKLGVISFNGNKVITTGGGGMIITNDKAFADHARHITTTAKITHAFEYVHDEIGYNYRLPNINAALGCAQMEQLPRMLRLKKQVNEQYRHFFELIGIEMPVPLLGYDTNNWLNSIILSNKKERDDFLTYTNNEGVMTRPSWKLISELEMYKFCLNDGLKNSRWLADRIVNIPSSVPASSA